MPPNAASAVRSRRVCPPARARRVPARLVLALFALGSASAELVPGRSTPERATPRRLSTNTPLTTTTMTTTTRRREGRRGARVPARSATRTETTTTTSSSGGGAPVVVVSSRVAASSSERIRGGGGGAKGPPTRAAQQQAASSADTPTKLSGAIIRAACWTVAESALLYAAFAWAAAAREPKLEVVVAVAAAFGSSALADAVLAVTAAACSAPVRQLLVPGRTPGDQAWYAALPKPRWNPPAWLFPVMWLVVAKPTQIFALARLRGGRLDVAARLAYATHLALGDTWNRVFFGEQLVGLGVALIYLFFASLACAAALFYRLDHVAGLLLLPTLAWVAVASTLNLRIWQLGFVVGSSDKATTHAASSAKKKKQPLQHRGGGPPGGTTTRAYSAPRGLLR